MDPQLRWVTRIGCILADGPSPAQQNAPRTARDPRCPYAAVMSFEAEKAQLIEELATTQKEIRAKYGLPSRENPLTEKPAEPAEDKEDTPSSDG